MTTASDTPEVLIIGTEELVDRDGTSGLSQHPGSKEVDVTLVLNKDKMMFEANRHNLASHSPVLEEELKEYPPSSADVAYLFV